MSNNILKIRKGGKGKKFELRNRLIVLARKRDSRAFSFGLLGEILGLNKTTVRDIFVRDEKDFDS